MFRRLFFTAVGLGAGVALGIYAVRKAEAAQRAMRPEALADAASRRAGGVSDRLRLAVDQGRAAAADKEAELRAVYRVTTPPDTA